MVQKMKTVLILVLSSENPPYKKMIETSLNTWDSIEVEGVESVFYCGKSENKNTDKIIYFPLFECYATLGDKTLMAFEWALRSKKFDYIARVNASCYVNKKELIKYIQTLPDTNVFAGLEVAASETQEKWMWGGGQYVYSKDIIQKIVDNKSLWDHSKMDDVAVSHLANKLEIPYTRGKACSINKQDKNWLLLSYGSGENFEFTDFSELNKMDNQFFIRVKHDPDRSVDEYVMKEIFKNLK